MVKMKVTCKSCGSDNDSAPPYSGCICNTCGSNTNDDPVIERICPSCNQIIKETMNMTDEQLKEFKLSGLCRTCQNAYLG